MKNSKTKLKLFAWLFILTGLPFILISLEALPIDEATIHAPKWVIGICGFIFSLSGVMVLLGEKSPVNNLLGGVLVLSFGLVGGWVALFGDASGFSGGLGILTNDQNVAIARFVFGSGAVLCFAIAFYAIKLQFRPNNNPKE
ncbi:MAG: hypothetical protein ABJK11_00495 [Balneola sp.]